MVSATRLQVLGEETVQETPPVSTDQPKTPDSEDKVAVQAWAAVRMGLGILSQRALDMTLAFAGLATGFILWRAILPDPSVNGIIGVSLYAAFMVSILLARR